MPTINPASELLKLYNMLLSLTETSAVKPPAEYREQVIAVKASLKNDESGAVNTILDFAVDCASKVKYYVETDNDNVTNIYNEWLEKINSPLRGTKVDVGVNGLAREYFRELFQGSSFILLRTIFEKQRLAGDSDTLELPSLAWLADGKDIDVQDNSRKKKIGSEKYRLKIGKGNKKDDFLPLPSLKNEEIFIQTPYESWGTKVPTPFLIRRGIWKNMKVLELVSDKGEGIIRKALDYLFVILKGDSNLAAQGNENGFYSKEELDDVKDAWKTFLADIQVEKGLPTSVSNFDTQMDHLIPDFTKVMKQELQIPAQRKILQGLGLIEIIEGTGTTRKEAVLNPKPFIKLVNAAIDSYCMLLKDIIEKSIERNQGRTKYKNIKIQVKASPVIEFISPDEKDFLRSVFDRGSLDFQTFIEDVVGKDYQVILNRSKKQLEEGTQETLYPHYIINRENEISPIEQKRHGQPSTSDDPDSPEFKDDRDGAGRINFIQAKRMKVIAPFRNLTELPKAVKKLSKEKRVVWRNVFNRTLNKHDDEERAFRTAWNVVNRIKRNEMKSSRRKK